MGAETETNSGEKGNVSENGNDRDGQVHDSVQTGSTQGAGAKNASVDTEVKPGLRNFGRSRHFTNSKGEITPHWSHPEAFTKSI